MNNGANNFQTKRGMQLHTPLNLQITNYNFKNIIPIEQLASKSD